MFIRYTLLRPLLNGLLLTACLLPSEALFGQAMTAEVSHSCGFDQRHQQRMRTDAAYRQRVLEFDERVRNADFSEIRGGGPLLVPVVVHVMETGNSLTQITDDQIRDGIRWMNERYRKIAGTPGNGNGVDTNIEFALAVRDPNGNCTNGITRYDMSGNATYMASGVFSGSVGISDASLKSLRVWDQTEYYNIWLISEIDNNNGGAGVQGYAYFSSSHGSAEDGCVMLVNSYKDPTSITLAHELGHALNLYHTFEGDDDGTICPGNGDCSSDGDQVCDTPPHIRSNSDCNTGGTNSCDGGSSNALFKNNYMDYSGDACQNMFTSGQNGRLQPALTVDRASFLAVNGNMALVPPGPPVMDMLASKALLCGTGQSVRLYDRSSCIPNTYMINPGFPGITFAWTLTNGTETHNSSDQNPLFTLNSTGVYNATLVITTGLGSFTRTEQGMVVVVSAPVSACTPTSSNTGNFAQTVSSVSFGTISSTTSTLLNAAYTDLSCTQNTVLATGGTYPLAVSINAGGSAAESLNGYIDWNNNGAFEDPSERVITGSTPASSSTTLNANVTVPGGAVTNTLLRMRIYGEAGTLSATERTCGAAFFVGDVEDYGVYVSGTVASVSIAASPGTSITYGTNVTFTPTPVNGGASPTYVWFRNGASVGTSATYQSNNLLPGETIRCEMTSNLAGVFASPALSNTLTMTVTGPPLSDFSGTPRNICAGGTVGFTDASALGATSWSWSFPGGTPSSSTAQNPVITYAAPGTYNVTLTASNASGTGTVMTKTGYITVYAVPNAGCTVTRSSAPAVGIGITNVTLGSINNTTVYDGAVMNDYSCTQVVQLSPSTLYNISVTVGAFNNQWVRVYIDYDGNGNFTGVGEQIFAPANGTGVRSGSFTTPAAPTPNTLRRMRVVTDFLNTTPGPCTTPLQYGQVEEYGVVFTAPAAVQLRVRAMLEGAYNVLTGQMSDGLRTNALIPATEPYTGLGYTYVGGGGGTVAPAVLAVSGSDAIVDWVVVELRDNSTPTTVVASKPALVQRDGDVVANDGTSALSFSVPSGTYRVALRHRNHLGVMTLNGVALSGSSTTVDMTTLATGTFGTNARKSITGAFPTQALWAGDVTFQGVVQYTGSGNDRDPILTTVGSTTPNSTTVLYSNSDVNMNGTVQYTGSGNDRDPILVNVGSTTPNNVLQQQLP